MIEIDFKKTEPQKINWTTNMRNLTSKFLYKDFVFYVSHLYCKLYVKSEKFNFDMTYDIACDACSAQLQNCNKVVYDTIKKYYNIDFGL